MTLTNEIPLYHCLNRPTGYCGLVENSLVHKISFVWAHL